MSREIYRQVSVRIWGDSRFRRLSAPPPSGQGLWLYLITGPHTINIPGVIPVSPAVIGASLRWPADAFAHAFAEVIREGLAEADPEAGLIWLPKGLRHNPPQSINCVKSWAKTWPLVPESRLKSKVWHGLNALLEGISDAFADAFRHGCEKPSAIQEQEQDQDQIHSGAAAPPFALAPVATPKCPKGHATNPDHRRFTDLWTELYRSCYARPYVWTKRDHGIVARLLKQAGFDECVTRARLMLSRQCPDWIKGVRDLGTLSVVFNRLVSEDRHADRVAAADASCAAMQARIVAEIEGHK